MIPDFFPAEASDTPRKPRPHVRFEDPMCHPADCDTVTSLLSRLRHDPKDAAAWARFERLFGPTIYGWCRKWRLQDADARDVTQAVFLKLARALPNFAYDPGRNFRGWLKTVARNVRSDYLSCRDRAGRGRGGDDAGQDLDRLPAREPSGDVFDRELLARAGLRVRRRVTGPTWEAFRRTALEGQSGKEASTATGLRVAQVFVARSRVLKLLRQEVRRPA
jgi:RNA polymerase sigma factor (sigma-70 family)